MKRPRPLLLVMLFKAKDFVKFSPVDIYSARVGRIPSPSKEHIIPKKYLSKQAARNPHNIFICTSLVNSLRGSLPFGVINREDKTRLIIDGATGLEKSPVMSKEEHFLCIRNKTHWMPPFHARGPIARTCLYMLWMYPEMTRLFPTHRDLIEEWSTYPVSEWELIRNEKVSQAFGIDPNPFVVTSSTRPKVRF